MSVRFKPIYPFHLSRDPEQGVTPNGKSYIKISSAFQGERKQDKTYGTIWGEATFYSTDGNFPAPIRDLKKGMNVLVDPSNISIRTYQDKNTKEIIPVAVFEFPQFQFCPRDTSEASPYPVPPPSGDYAEEVDETDPFA